MHIAAEPDQDKDDFRELLQGMLDPQLHIAPAIRRSLADGEFDIFFLTGIGEVFPYIRSHNVLNNLQSVVTGKPMLMFFPGLYEQSNTLGSSLGGMLETCGCAGKRVYLPGSSLEVHQARPAGQRRPGRHTRCQP
jgi:Domain of unknown function (DUF1788)